MKEIIPAKSIEREPTDPLKEWLREELPKEYKRQIQTLNKLGLLDLLVRETPEGAKGIIGIDQREYPLPKLEEIERMIKENEELYRKKIEQFTDPETGKKPKLLITPFALPLNLLIKTLEKAILDHHKKGKLFATRKNPDDPNEEQIPLELNKNQPVYTWDGWKDSDTNETCVYFPKKFTRENHQGKTKKETLEEQQKEDHPFKGYLVSLIEPNPNIPRQGKGKTIAGRKQIETNKTPEEYLEMLKNNPQYKSERPKTLEDWLTQAMTHLEETNEVIDDYAGNGSASYCPGSFHPISVNVGFAFWDRSSRQVNVTRSGSRDHNDAVTGLAFAVGLNS